MPPSTRPAARIPAALLRPLTPHADDTPTQIHFTVLVPDERIEKVLRDRVRVLGPVYPPFSAHVHFVVEDKTHRAAGVDPAIRHALLELELVNPDQVGFSAPVQVTLGWPPFEEPA
jgi:hypothetical protein